jgi:hypothetical protein
VRSIGLETVLETPFHLQFLYEPCGRDEAEEAQGVSGVASAAGRARFWPDGS